MNKFMLDPTPISQPELAELLSISPRRLRQLAEDGVIKATGRGVYNLSDAVTAYVQYLQRMSRESGFKTVNIDIQAARARIALANAQEAEIKLALLKREAISIADIEALWSGLFLNFKANLVASSQRIAQEVAAETSERKVAQMLKDEMFKCLDELSRTPIPTAVQD